MANQLTPLRDASPSPAIRMVAQGSLLVTAHIKVMWLHGFADHGCSGRWRG
ncbi:hypothetical protein ACAG26_21710 [Mycobacterium sp. pUA109]|uniref:hypothetical protein n=1 Tax=Mycobacterium sp. pUA109 TaxID=3238982 RepID=UPI00351AC375